MRAWVGLAFGLVGAVGLAGCGGSGSSSGGTPQYQSPTANAGGPYSGVSGAAITFSAAGSSDPQGQALTYAWNFGDSSIGTGTSPSHAYATAGTYLVSLTVTDTSGLSGSATSKATIAAPLADTALTGTVYGGQQPVSGAHVYLLAANTTGYGGLGIAATSSDASISLLSSSLTGASDSVGAYVTTNSTGLFSMSGDYTCTSGQQLYVYATGAPGAAWMAALGACPGTSGPAITVTVNEVSTVAAAYAMAGFATDATHVSSSGTALAQSGIANAFLNATNLETLSTGVALATTPAGDGTAPQMQINTLANILANCSVGGVHCAELFAGATADGTSAGAKPSDTATAAINIAHFPTSNYSLSDLVAGPFQPYYSVPNNWVVALNFGGGNMNGPSAIAIDATGNAWVTSFYTNCIFEFSSLGSMLSGPNGYTGGGIASPKAIAIDEAGNAWVANAGSNSVTKLSNSGALLSGGNGFTGGGLNNMTGAVFQPNGIAIDAYGDAWVVNTTGEGVVEFSSAGSPLSGATGYGGSNLASPRGLAIDASGNVWIMTFSGIVKMSASGSILPGYTGSGLSTPTGVAFDAAGNAWIANHADSNVVELSSSGSVLSGSSGYTPTGILQPASVAIDGSGNAFVTSWGAAGLVEISNSGVTPPAMSSFYGQANVADFNYPDGIAIDGSGDVWVTSNVANVVIEIVGAAAPVVTPLSVGVKNSMLATRP